MRLGLSSLRHIGSGMGNEIRDRGEFDASVYDDPDARPDAHWRYQRSYDNVLKRRDATLILNPACQLRSSSHSKTLSLTVTWGRVGVSAGLYAKARPGEGRREPGYAQRLGPKGKSRSSARLLPVAGMSAYGFVQLSSLSERDRHPRTVRFGDGCADRSIRHKNPSTKSVQN